MRTLNKTFIASAVALTIGLVAAPAFAGGNAYNPLAPDAYSNDTQFGPAGTDHIGNAVGSIFVQNDGSTMTVQRSR